MTRSRSSRPANSWRSPPTVPVHGHTPSPGVYRIFVDRHGTPIRRLIRSAHFTETYSANGRSLSTISVAPAHLRAAGGELTITATGNQRHVLVPGFGPVFAQAGRFVVDPETSSLRAVYGINKPAEIAFCPALSV
jgi:hypothetical protein